MEKVAEVKTPSKPREAGYTKRPAKPKNVSRREEEIDLAWKQHEQWKADGER